MPGTFSLLKPRLLRWCLINRWGLCLIVAVWQAGQTVAYHAGAGGGRTYSRYNGKAESAQVITTVSSAQKQHL